MGRLTIYRDNHADTTVISNYFIDTYMKDANDAQIKIYLYLLRMMGANLPTSISDMADKFNHTEKDILRSLKYWEKQKLLSLDYDENNALTGIHLLDCNQDTTPARQPADIVALAPVVSITPKKPSYKKPSYSLDQLSSFSKQENAQELMFVAESYLGRQITSSDMRSLYFFVDELHFSNDLIDFLLGYCIDRNKKDFKYMEAVAINWAENNITTPKQAARFASKYDKSVYAIMNDLGRTNFPTETEFAFINRWMKEYGFETDIIKEACRRTVLATDSHRFEYADKILSSWKDAGIKRLTDIKEADSDFQKRRASATKNNNKFNQFTQNTYDYTALEKEILSN